MAITALTQENFEAEVEKQKGIVLVDFWASWCGPCKMIAPIIEEIAEGKDLDIKVAKVDVDEEADLAERFHVMSIPTLILFQDGKAEVTSVGVKSKKAILEMIEGLKAGKKTREPGSDTGTIENIL